MNTSNNVPNLHDCYGTCNECRKHRAKTLARIPWRKLEFEEQCEARGLIRAGFLRLKDGVLSTC